MLRLDEDLGPFHARCRAMGGRWAPAGRGLGRLLRSPTLFEDVIKTICTTNIQWGGTRVMVRQLVHSLGDSGPVSGGDGGFSNAFPTPERIATADAAELDSTRLGYRAPYVRELAERVASGELDLSALEDDRRSTDELRKALLDLKGVGPYAAATLLMLLGRYDYLAVDSVYRTFVTERYFAGRRPSDAEAAAVYEDWGRWKYLGYWFDLWQGAAESV
jgi:3-methyladenine DNA glycosylase/8-oxoguanine DNA glycosylase